MHTELLKPRHYYLVSLNVLETYLETQNPRIGTAASLIYVRNVDIKLKDIIRDHYARRPKVLDYDVSYWKLSVCVCVRVRVCACVRVYVYACVVYIYAYLKCSIVLCLCVCMHACMYLCRCIHGYSCIRSYVHMHSSPLRNEYMHVTLYTCIHTPDGGKQFTLYIRTRFRVLWNHVTVLRRSERNSRRCSSEVQMVMFGYEGSISVYQGVAVWQAVP